MTLDTVEYIVWGVFVLVLLYLCGLALWVWWMGKRCDELVRPSMNAAADEALNDFEATFAHFSPLHWLRSYRKWGVWLMRVKYNSVRAKYPLNAPDNAPCTMIEGKRRQINAS